MILTADWLFKVVVQQLSLTDVENCFCFNFITLNAGYGNWVIASVLSWRFYGSHAGVLCRAHNWQTRTGQFSDRSTVGLSCTREPGHLSHSWEHRATLWTPHYPKGITGNLTRLQSWLTEKPWSIISPTHYFTASRAALIESHQTDFCCWITVEGNYLQRCGFADCGWGKNIICLTLFQYLC